MPEFLLEIGCEEIPARMIDAAQSDLVSRVGQLLAREALGSAEGISALSTPRRLSVTATVTAAQADVAEQVNGPSVTVAFKDGQPTPAAHAFAKKVGLDVSRLSRVTTPKGEYLSAQVTKKGRSASDILSEALPREIAGIYWPKNMYWRKPSEKFVRPVRWLVAMLDGQVVPLEFDGIQAGSVSRGHRLLADRPVQIPQAGSGYIDALQQAKVLGREARELQIRKALDAATRTIPGARWREDKALLDKVVNLTEFPSVVLGNFEAEFLELPEEVLVTVMRDHQNYFAIEDANHKLLPHFLAVLNTDGDPQGIIRHGHERVLRARFNDARFFWQTDQKHSLRERVEWLKHVTFQKDLGSYYEKTIRVQRLCSWLCELVKNGGLSIRPGVVHKAAYLSKTDLTTELVKEFTELQGIVGGLYARAQQLDSELPEATRFLIGDAIYDQYKPESMEDSVPRTIEGAVLSIGDKADTIAGMFALGLVPSGSKDPFALRRQANGIVKILGEKQINLSLVELLSSAVAPFADMKQHPAILGDLRHVLRPLRPSGKFVADKASIENEGASTTPALGRTLGEFFVDRLQFYLTEYLGLRTDIVKAVTTSSSDDVLEARHRVEAVVEIADKQEFRIIATAFKRMRNILRQAREKGVLQVPGEYRRDLFEKAERDLFDKMQPIGRVYVDALSRRSYREALNAFVELAPYIDRFFDDVMVMVDDPAVRGNRLLFLNEIGRSFRGVADFSEIATEGKL